MMPSTSRLAAFLLLTIACGWRSGLNVPEPPEDAASPDGGPPPVIDADVPPPIVDVCLDLPPREPPESIDVRFVARIATADVLFLVDVTGSMVEETEQIRRSLREEIAPALAEAIPDVHMAVASLADFAVSPYGDASDVPFRMITTSTSDVSAVQTGLDTLMPSGGNDVPESQVEALYQVATGRGIARYVPPALCPSGTIGYPCFRAGGSRVVLLFTDAEFHNGPRDHAFYERSLLGVQPATYPQAVAELNAIGAKVLGLFSGGDFGGGSTAIEHLREIARDTGAVTVDDRGNEEPLVVDIGLNGELLGPSVVDLVRTLVDEVPIDVDVIIEDWPGDAIDARQLVTSVVTTGARPANGAIDLGDRYQRVRPGTDVGFRVFLANERIERGADPVSYYLLVVLRGDGATRLRETLVQVVIPSIDGRGCEEAF